jgi:hypothetical protein
MVVTLHNVDVELPFRRRHEDSLIDSKLALSATRSRQTVTYFLNTRTVQFSKRTHDSRLSQSARELA